MRELRTWAQVKNRLYQNPEFRLEQARFAPQRQVAIFLVKLRVENGWSQRELAQRLKLKQSEISRIEAGDRNLSLKTVQRIAEATHTKLVLQFSSAWKSSQ